MMDLAYITLPKTVFPKHSPVNRYCLVVADIAVKRFIMDTKTLVRDGILHQTKEAITSADVAMKDNGIRRRDNMDRWYASDRPLSYDEEAFLPLLRCLQTPHGPMSMPLGHPQSMTTMEVAALMHDMVRADNPIQRRAPISGKGTFYSVLKVAYGLIMDRAADRNEAESPSQFFVKILAVILDTHKVQHIPWSPPAPPAGAAGRPTRKAVYNYWRSTAKTLESGQTALLQVLEVEERDDLQTRSVVRDAAESSPTTSWSALDFTLADLGKFLHKQGLPEECDAEDAATYQGDDYVNQTYTWVIGRYNPKKPIHHLALIIAIMFTKIIPHTTHGKCPSRIFGIRNTDTVTAAVRTEPWIQSTSTRKGDKDPNPFLIMVFVYIVAMMEPNSPLQTFINSDAQHSLGSPWTKKHGKQSRQKCINESRLTVPNTSTDGGG
jgi:hypothetical protein